MWKLYSLIAAILIGANNIFYKYTLKLRKEEYVMYSCFIVIGMAIFGLLYLISTNQLKKYSEITLKKKLVMMLMSLFFFVGILYFYKGLPLSHNISLNTGIFAGGKIATVLLVTCVFFKETLSFKQGTALALIVGGILLMGYK